MFNEEHKGEWVALGVIGIILLFLFNFNILELFRLIFVVGFSWVGYKLLVEYNIIDKLNKNGGN